MKKLIYCIGVSFFLVCNLCGCSGRSYFEDIGKVDVSAKSIETDDSEGDAAVPEDEALPGQSKEDEKDVVYVQVSGAVKSPGVFEMSPDARVFEVIEKAGGLTEDADDMALNQAAPVADGQKIYVYTADEARQMAVEQQASADTGGKININTASKEELLTLSGIGESKAEAIISYRNAHGSFTKPEDLMNIPGIKEGVYSKISESICAY